MPRILRQGAEALYAVHLEATQCLYATDAPADGLGRSTRTTSPGRTPRYLAMGSPELIDGRHFLSVSMYVSITARTSASVSLACGGTSSCRDTLYWSSARQKISASGIRGFDRGAMEGHGLVERYEDRKSVV